MPLAKGGECGVVCNLRGVAFSTPLSRSVEHLRWRDLSQSESNPKFCWQNSFTRERITNYFVIPLVFLYSLTMFELIIK